MAEDAIYELTSVIYSQYIPRERYSRFRARRQGNGDGAPRRMQSFTVTGLLCRLVIPRAGVADLYGDGIFIRDFGLALANFLLPVQPFRDALGVEECICEGKFRKFSSNFSVCLVS